ncbi:MAG TPA: hypothetical protein VF247_05660 [Candidatus Krumholzibacteria bacterium]
MSILPGSARTTLLFSGAGAVSGVGSLPFMSPGAALEFIARWCPQVPFWPQLRRMSPREAMIPQVFGAHARHLSPIRGEHGYGIASDRTRRFIDAIERGDATFDPANAAGFFAFLDACRRGMFPEARALKGQMMGPVTTACAISVEGTLLVDDPGLRQAITGHITRLARWQVERLLSCAGSVILVLDEAYLGRALRDNPLRRDAVVEMLRTVILRVRRPGVVVGIHCCDEIPLSVLNDIEADLFSFDAHNGGCAFATDPDGKRFVARGGQVAWGWVPTLDDLARVEPDEIVDRWIEAAAGLCAGDDRAIHRVAERSLVTASCGLAGSSIPTCERSFRIATDVSAGFARRAVPT